MGATDRLKLAVSKYKAGLSLKNAAEAAGMTQSWQLLRKHLIFSNQMRSHRVRKEEKDPSPEAIEQMCKQIQAAWTPEEMSRRWVGRSGIRRAPCRVLVSGRVA
jgi:hypothetical protein